MSTEQLPAKLSRRADIAIIIYQSQQITEKSGSNQPPLHLCKRAFE